MKIAIIGHGFVGKAADYGFTTPEVEKVIIDPALYGNSTKDLAAHWDLDYAFVCVPTPMGEDGSVDSSIVEAVATDVIRYTSANVIIKSTVAPDRMRKLINWFDDMDVCDRIIYNPEFLVEKSALQDFINPPFHIIGCEGKSVANQMKRLYNEYSNCTPAEFIETNQLEASFIKYGINTFLATKVTFFNQLFDTIQRENKEGSTKVNFNTVANAIGGDERVGLGHTRVPGFDQKQGYGGACFPKDVRAFVKYAKEFTLLEKVDKINNDYRKVYEKDEREIAQSVKYE